jgi:hypothetical protein
MRTILAAALLCAGADGAMSRQGSDFQWDNHAILVR